MAGQTTSKAVRPSLPGSRCRLTLSSSSVASVRAIESSLVRPLTLGAAAPKKASARCCLAAPGGISTSDSSTFASDSSGFCCTPSGVRSIAANACRREASRSASTGPANARDNCSIYSSPRSPNTARTSGPRAVGSGMTSTARTTFASGIRSPPRIASPFLSGTTRSDHARPKSASPATGRDFTTCGRPNASRSFPPSVIRSNIPA